MSKLSQLNKEQIKEINACLRKKGHKPFSAKELKALDEDVLSVCYASDEFAVRGMILRCHLHYALVLRSAYAYSEVLVLQNKDFAPIFIGERFDVLSCKFEGEEDVFDA